MRRFDEFELHEPLRVGTVGTIYRASDLEHQQEVALKVLLPTVSSDDLIKARFEREMLILEKLSHPNIVQYFGGGRQGSQLFYAMELVDGGTLKDILEQTDGDVPAAKAIDRGREVLVERLKRLRGTNQSRDVSWASLACLMLAIIGVVSVAFCLGI